MLLLIFIERIEIFSSALIRETASDQKVRKTLSSVDNLLHLDPRFYGGKAFISCLPEVSEV